MFKTKEEAYQEGLIKAKSKSAREKAEREQYHPVSDHELRRQRATNPTNWAEPDKGRDAFYATQESQKRKKFLGSSRTGGLTQRVKDEMDAQEGKRVSSASTKKPTPAVQAKIDEAKKSGLIKSLFNNGHRESALLLKNWDEMDANAIEMQKSLQESTAMAAKQTDDGQFKRKMKEVDTENNKTKQLMLPDPIDQEEVPSFHGNEGVKFKPVGPKSLGSIR